MPPARPSPHAARPRTRSVLRHPRVGLALRASLAAGLAWFLARQMPGVAQDYAFYAPFGAVATMHPVVSRTFREAATGVVAIVLGAGVGLAAEGLLGGGTLALVAVVAVGVLVAGLRWLGPSRSYVPLAGVFVLVLGQGHEMQYAAAYAGLFLMGAALGLAVTAALPTLPVRAADGALGELRDGLARHLDDVADHLDPAGSAEGPPPPPAPPAQLLTRARAAVEDLAAAVPGNPRARRHRAALRLRSQELTALERVALLTEDLGAVSTDRPWGSSLPAVSPELRAPLSRALRALSGTVASAGLEDTDPGSRTQADDALVGLGAALDAHVRRRGADADALVTAAVVTTLRRALSSLTPEDAISLVPTPTGARPDDLGHGDADDRVRDDGPAPPGGTGPS